MTHASTADRAVALLASAGAQTLWEPLRADGYAVNLSAAGEAVTVTVSAEGDACADCLAPATVLRDIILLFLRECGVDTDQITVTVDVPAGHGPAT